MLVAECLGGSFGDGAAVAVEGEACLFVAEFGGDLCGGEEVEFRFNVGPLRRASRMKPTIADCALVGFSRESHAAERLRGMGGGAGESTAG